VGDGQTHGQQDEHDADLARPAEDRREHTEAATIAEKAREARMPSASSGYDPSGRRIPLVTGVLSVQGVVLLQ